MNLCDGFTPKLGTEKRLYPKKPWGLPSDAIGRKVAEEHLGTCEFVTVRKDH